MAQLSGFQIIAKVLKEEGIEWIAGIHGGSLFQLLKATDEENIRMFHMRDEQSAVYLCDGWSKVTRRPSVCFAYTPPGTLNMTSAIAHSFMTRSPVVAIGGSHLTFGDPLTRHHLGHDVEVFKPITKRSERLTDWRYLAAYFQRALREAVTYPPGPVFIDFAVEVGRTVGEEKDQIGYLPGESSAVLDRGEGNPADIERAVRLLLEAEKPLIVGGNGIWWAEATDEFKEFVELLRIPVRTSELARGTVPEDHPLAFRGRYAGALLANADVVAIFGLLMANLEGYGQPPLYPRLGKKYILVSESREDLEVKMPSAVRILANPKRVLRQMIDCARDIIKEPQERREWLGTLARYKQAYLKAQRERSEKVCHDSPINPHFLAQEVASFLDNDATIILDSHTFSGFMPNRYIARFPGHVLDAGMIIGVGHSVGNAIGVQLARPGKQVLGLIGDGGLGIAGFDLETAARYKIPAVWLLFNNSSWMQPAQLEKNCPIKDSFGMLKDIRYDKIAEELGCHGEFVTEPEQIRPALERAFNSGKPAVINVIPDDRILPPFSSQPSLSPIVPGQTLR